MRDNSQIGRRGTINPCCAGSRLVIEQLHPRPEATPLAQSLGQ